jgi:hypothetical protein
VYTIAALTPLDYRNASIREKAQAARGKKACILSIESRYNLDENDRTRTKWSMVLETVREALESLRAFVGQNHVDVLIVCCLMTALAFVLSFMASIRSRRLRREVEGLRRTNQRLIAAEEKRILKELKGEPRP